MLHQVGEDRNLLYLASLLSHLLSDIQPKQYCKIHLGPLVQESINY